MRLQPQPWTEAEYRMFTITRDEAEPNTEDISRIIGGTFPIGGGVALVGGFRSVVMADFGWGVSAQRFAIDAMFYAVAQNIMLKRLFRQAELLVEPMRDPGAAVALSRGVLAYRAVFWWDGAGRPEAEGRLIHAYHEQNALGELEADLSSFETAAQAAISAQTNLLLGLITVLGLALAVGVAAIQGAGWTGDETLWGLVVAIGTAAALLMLPMARALRQALLWR